MGIRNFYRFIQKYAPETLENKKLGDYSGKILGIDANLLLYKLLFRNLKHNSNFNKDSKEDNEDYELYYLQLIDIVCCSYKFNIKFLFVFDGKTPDIKTKTVIERKEKRHKAQEEMNIINEDILELEKYINNDDFEEDEHLKELMEKKRALMARSLNLKNKIIKETKEFLTMCGIPYIDSMNEADSQLAYLSKNNLIDGIISNDFDILTFGGKSLLIDFFDCFRNNFDKKITEISLDKLLKKLEISHNNFIELCILMGTDYSDKPSLRFEDIYINIKNNKKYFYNDIKLPPNLDMELITKYFKDCYAFNYTKSSFDEEIKFHNANEEKIINFINIKKNVFIKDKHIKDLCFLIQRLMFFTNRKKN
jgi:flap endonuclease-1